MYPLRAVVSTTCAHRVFRNGYSPSTKQYRLTVDKLTDSLTMYAMSPFETRKDGNVNMSYDAGERWGVSVVGALTDKNASYPDLMLKWSWVEPPKGKLLVIVEYQVTEGVQPNPDLVQIFLLDQETGSREIPLLKKVRDWKHLDSGNQKVGVLLFAEAAPTAEDDLRAGVIVKFTDATTFTGVRTSFTTASILMQDVAFEALDGVGQSLEQAALIEHLCPTFQIGSDALKHSYQGTSAELPDMVDLKGFQVAELVDALEEHPACV